MATKNLFTEKKKLQYKVTQGREKNIGKKPRHRNKKRSQMTQRKTKTRDGERRF
jgi:hypothetical protein